MVKLNLTNQEGDALYEALSIAIRDNYNAKLTYFEKDPADEKGETMKLKKLSQEEFIVFSNIILQQNILQNLITRVADAVAESKNEQK